MARPLPEFVSRYFDEAGTPDRLPEWLLSDFEDDSWLIGLPDHVSPNESACPLTRRVSWRTLLPHGRLADPPLAKLLNHCKQALLGAAHLTKHGAEPTLYVPSFHRQIVNYAEFLCVSQPRETRAKGLGASSTASLTAYVERYAEAGIVGTGFWCERWDKFVLSCIDQNCLEADEFFRAEAGYGVEVTESHIREMRHWLQTNNWIEDGWINKRKVAAAIRVDLLRLTRKAGKERFFGEHLERYQPQPKVHLSKAPAPSAAALNGVFSGLRKLKIVCAKSDTLSVLPLATVDLEAAIEPRLRGHTRSRTPTLALPKVLRATEQAILYVENFGPALASHWEQLVAGAELRMKAFPGASEHQCLQDAFDSTEIPVALAPLNIRMLETTDAVKEARRCTSYPDSALREQLGLSLGLLDAISILKAAAIFLMVFLTCSRLAESLSLDRGDISREHGRSYVRIKLRKRFENGRRLRRTKPIPEILHRALSLVDRFAMAATRFGHIRDPRTRERVFVEYGPISVRPLPATEVYSHLRLMMNLFMPGEDSDDGTQWYPRPHECRRAFAMSFFHINGQEATLPALSWIMGHQCLEETWRYIKEEMTGAEITRLEAELAFYAIGCPQKDKGALALQEALMKHFGVETLDVVDERDVKSYLELLYEQGYYNVKPHEIRTRTGSRYAVLTLVTGDD